MKIDFNREWYFSKYGSEEKKIISLPHDAMLWEKRDKTARNGSTTSWFPGGKYVYEKNFFVPVENRDKCIYLEFEGVYRKADVFINDEFILHHSYGYTGFFVPCENLRYGEENTVRVVADNSLEPNSRWYTGSGIYRPVWLHIRNRDYIKDLKITTVSINPAVIRVECSHKDAKVKITFDSSEVYCGKTGEIEIPEARLWSDKDPNLYECTVSIPDDEVSCKFGIRKLEWSAGKGFTVNGNSVKFRGSCVHHDNGLLGACAYAEAEERKVRILKEHGYNAVRSAHNPCSKAFLDACDKYGIYVMDEAFDQWFIPKNKYDYAKNFDENYLSDLKAMVEKDINHPSVVMYSIGNEISETQQERGIKLTKEMTEYVKALDSTRPVTCGINLFLNGLVSLGLGIYKEEGENIAEKATTSDSMKGLGLVGSAFYNNIMTHLPAIKNVVSKAPFADKATKDAFSHLDICGYNYGSGRYKMDTKKYPDRVIIGSEAYITDLYDNWQKTLSSSALLGEFLWTGWDYLGEAGIGCWTYDGLGGVMSSYPFLLAGCGAIDILGNAGCEQYYIENAFGVSKKMHMGVRPVNQSRKKAAKSPWRMTDALESWSWDGCEDENTEVEVYCNADEVEIYLNGEKKGKARPQKCIARFSVPYEKGSLEAVAYKNGRETERAMLVSAEKETMLTVIPEFESFKEIAYIDISVTDKNGIVRVLDDRKIKVTVSGAGELIALGSANPVTEESYISDECSTYYGKAKAIVRKSGNVGEIKITVSSDGLETKQIILEKEN